MGAIVFGINELRAAISASDARSLRQHAEIMDELHDIHMQIETLYDVLDRAMAEMAPTKLQAKPSTTCTPVIESHNVKVIPKANHLKKKMKP